MTLLPLLTCIHCIHILVFKFVLYLYIFMKGFIYAMNLCLINNIDWAMHFMIFCTTGFTEQRVKFSSYSVLNFEHIDVHVLQVIVWSLVRALPVITAYYLAINQVYLVSNITTSSIS